MNQNAFWIPVLVIAIIMSFTLRHPLGIVQAIAAALLLGIKIAKRNEYD